MRYFLYIIFSSLACTAYSQQMTVLSKVTDDSISIKWIAGEFSELQAMTNGATISRAESEKPQNFQLVNFTGAKTWTIEPTKKRFDQLGSSQEDEKFEILIEPFLTGNSSEEEKNFAKITAMIENMVNPRFQYVFGNILVDKEFDKSKT
ncbi:MAG: hypothetical protein P8P74_01250, partial [Crocinitomicaceae bacterium]|nr:hypothetical protein [Crocinitomicaceae bacterium]